MKHNFAASLLAWWLFTDICRAAKRIHNNHTVSDLVSVDTKTTNTSQHSPIPDNGIIRSLHTIYYVIHSQNSLTPACLHRWVSTGFCRIMPTITTDKLLNFTDVYHAY